MLTEASGPAGEEQETEGEPAAGEAPAPAPAPELLVDRAVSRAKFERELADYRRMDGDYIRRGWLMVRAEFPKIIVLFAAPQLKPSGVVLGVRLDFTNYDLWPPSVTFVHPFTLEPLPPEQVIPIHKRLPPVPLAGVALPGAIQIAQAGPFQIPAEQPADGVEGMFMIQREPQNLVQAHEGGSPFLCVAGVREYHQHPFHSNDPWLAHRATGVGTLYHILDIIHRHGVAPLQQWKLHVNLNVQIGEAVPDYNRVPE